MKLTDVLAHLEANKSEMDFLKTGFSKLDNDLDGGLLRKELVVIGGRTGIGKSYLAAQLLLNIARQGFKTAYFSLEISNEMVVSRLLGALSNIKSTRVRSGLLSLLELQQLTDSKAKLKAYENFMMFYDDLYQLEAIKKEIKINQNEFVVVDFIQNIMVPGADEYNRLSYVALELQKLAKEANCCVLVLSQLSNTVTREGMDSPVVEYKGSGNIATVCDLGFFIHRQQSVTPGQFDTLQLALKKNRRGTSQTYDDLVFQQPGGWIYEQTEG
ncbi:MAG: AAA family ATPase [Candidatus Levybacteria bacterium]|nr:AAA family ATPase [Candidatus Levybacteria bacterium]